MTKLDSRFATTTTLSLQTMMGLKACIVSVMYRSCQQKCKTCNLQLHYQKINHACSNNEIVKVT